MTQTFHMATIFDRDLSSWNVSSVTTMRGMFSSTQSFRNSFTTGIGNWDVRSVQDMTNMFNNAVAFNTDISKWPIGNVKSFNNMFSGASSFNQSLCAFGSIISKNATVAGMFRNTACPDQSDPNLTATPPGPFCFKCTTMNT